MSILSLRNKIVKMPPLRVVKTLVNNSAEHYELFNNKAKVCSFDFTNYRGIDRFLSHGEVVNFTILKPFRRKIDGAKAIFQAENIITKTAKDKQIKFVMFTLPNALSLSVQRLMKRLGVYEYCIEDLSNRNFIAVINQEFLKNIKSRLFKSVALLNSGGKSILSKG